MEEFAKDPAIFDMCENIGKKFGLLIDQIGDLDMEVRRILLGKSKSEDLVNNLSRSLEINKVSAQQIVEEINKQIFSTIKLKMQDQTTYHTSLGNTQMNANTYPQSFKPINNIPTVQKSVEPEPVPVSPHADLEKAGGFTIEAVEAPLPSIEKTKPKTVELPKIQENLPEKQPEEVKVEPTNTFNIHDYYNFKNSSKEEVYNNDQNTDEKEEVESEPETETKGEDAVPANDQEVPEPETTEPEIVKTEDKPAPENTPKYEIPNNLPTEEVALPNPIKEEPEPVVNIEKAEPIKPPIPTTQDTQKPITDSKPRAFDPYREIPQ